MEHAILKRQLVLLGFLVKQYSEVSEKEKFNLVKYALERYYGRHYCSKDDKERSSKFIEILSLLFSDDINAIDVDGKSLLCLVVEHTDVDAVKFLLDKGADINQVCKNENKIVEYAVMCKWDSYKNEKICSDLVQLLWDHGADIDAVDAFGRTLLMRVAGKNCGEGACCIIQKLVEKGANVHAVDKMGKTAFHYACENPSESIVEQLLEAGANVNACDNDGNTGLMICAKKKMSERKFYSLTAGAANIPRGGSKMLKVLLKHKVDLGVVNKEGSMFLHIVCQNTDPYYVDFYNSYSCPLKDLVEAGFDINAVDRKANTALSIAYYNGNNNMIQILKSLGARNVVANQQVIEKIVETNEEVKLELLLSPSRLTVRNIGLAVLSSVVVCYLAKYFCENNSLKLH